MLGLRDGGSGGGESVAGPGEAGPGGDERSNGRHGCSQPQERVAAATRDGGGNLVGGATSTGVWFGLVW